MKSLTTRIYEAITPRDAGDKELIIRWIYDVYNVESDDAEFIINDDLTINVEALADSRGHYGELDLKIAGNNYKKALDKSGKLPAYIKFDNSLASLSFDSVPNLDLTGLNDQVPGVTSTITIKHSGLKTLNGLPDGDTAIIHIDDCPKLSSLAGTVKAVSKLTISECPSLRDLNCNITVIPNDRNSCGLRIDDESTSHNNLRGFDKILRNASGVHIEIGYDAIAKLGSVDMFGNNVDSISIIGGNDTKPLDPESLVNALPKRCKEIRVICSDPDIMKDMAYSFGVNPVDLDGVNDNKYRFGFTVKTSNGTTITLAK